jgi:uncharacterized protein YndB with AHSA1/START domain
MADQEAIVISRTFAAPRTRVFEAWTKPEPMKAWWGPNGFTAPVISIDPRPGGIFHGCMRGPDGQDYWSRGVYREVVVPERIVCTDSFADAQGNIVEPTQYGMSAEWPREALVTATFTDEGGGTRLDLRHDVGSAPKDQRDMCYQGWSESLDKLAAYLAAA